MTTYYYSLLNIEYQVFLLKPRKRKMPKKFQTTTTYYYHMQIRYLETAFERLQFHTRLHINKQTYIDEIMTTTLDNLANIYCTY